MPEGRADVVGLRGEMVRSGVLTPEQAANPAYFRHEVLKYAAVMNSAAQSNNVRAPFWHRRKGSEMSINVNYFEAESQWMYKAMMDVATQDFINQVDKSKYNARPELVRRAREHNHGAITGAIMEEIKNELGAVDLEFNTPISLAAAFASHAAQDPKAREAYKSGKLVKLREFNQLRGHIRTANRGLADAMRDLSESEWLSIPAELRGDVARLGTAGMSRGLNDLSESAPIFKVLSWAVGQNAIPSINERAVETYAAGHGGHVPGPE